MKLYRTREDLRVAALARIKKLIPVLISDVNDAVDLVDIDEVTEGLYGDDAVKDLISEQFESVAEAEW